MERASPASKVALSLHPHTQKQKLKTNQKKGGEKIVPCWDKNRGSGTDQQYFRWLASSFLTAKPEAPYLN